MTKLKRRPGPESTLSEVRGALVAAAIDDLHARGVDIGLDHIKLSDAIEAAGVTRSTAYRSLADDDLAPQDVLRRDVLSHVLRREARDANLAVVEQDVSEELARQQANFNSTDVAAHTRALRSIIRVGAAASYHSVAASTERSVLTAAYGALQSSDATDWRNAALRQGESNVTTLLAPLYLAMSELFHYRLRSDFTIEHFGTAAAACVEGMAMRSSFNDYLDDLTRPTGDAGANEPWTLYAVAFEGLFTAFFEPVDWDEPFADLTRY